MVPIRGQACYREAAVATVSVYDRKGRRLGTVYLGRMPEPGQGTLSEQLTALIEAVCRTWAGPGRGWCISPTREPTRPDITAGY